MDAKRISVLRMAFLSISSLIVLGIVYFAVTRFAERTRWGIIFLGLCLAASALNSLESLGGSAFFGLGRTKNNILACAVAILSVASAIYFYREYDALNLQRAGVYTLRDYGVAITILVLVVLVAWKETGPAVPAVSFAFLLYSIAGQYLPGIFFHSGLSFSRLIRVFVLEFEGIYGLLNQTGATLIAIFLVFSGLMSGFGGLEYITNACRKVFGKSVRAYPQIAVVGSMVFGSFSGSAAANVASTGSITIPLMKGIGVPPAKAAAIEAVASSAGQIMPPILGSAAFLMASFLGTSYWSIVRFSFAPAVVFYLSLSFAVFIIMRSHVVADKSAEMDVLARYAGKQSLSDSFRITDGIPLIVSVIVFIYAMGALRLDAMFGGLALVSAFLLSQFLYLLIVEKNKFLALKKYIANIIAGVERAAVYCCSIAALLALLGIIMRSLIATGLSQRLAFGMVDLAAGSLLLLLVLSMILSIIFGMAVSTVATYIVVVLLAAPALMQMGIEPVVSHFTVFYFGMLSAITPPVAVAAAVGANIAGAGFFKTCWESVKLGLGFFVFPFAFIVHPNILLGAAGSKTVVSLYLLVAMILLQFSLQWSNSTVKGFLLRIGAFTLAILGLFSPVIA